MRRRRSVTAGVGVLALVVAGAVTFNALTSSPSRPFDTISKSNPEYRQKVDFAVVCKVAAVKTDDPIVYPKQPGKSHVHVFAGNLTTDAFSTQPKLESGGTNCLLDRDKAAYWMPQLYNEQGVAVVPTHIRAYYRAGTLNPVKTLPRGLKIIAGNGLATAPQDAGIAGWQCRQVSPDLNTVKKQATIPTCASKDLLEGSVIFPNCWDGIHLNSADHKSHMSYSKADGNPDDCDAAHPVRVPQLTLGYRYKPGATNSRSYLASGNSGLTLHADFWNAWHQPTLDALVARCINASVHCGDVNPSHFPGTMPPLSATTVAATSTVISPVADSYVGATTPATNFGTKTQVRVDGSPLVNTYLRFNLPPGVVTARLELFANSAASAGYQVRTTSTWAETGITYNNAPAFSAPIASSGPVVAGQYKSADLTLPSGSVVNLVVTTSGPTAISLSSREGANPPRLVVTTSTTTTGATTTTVPPAGVCSNPGAANLRQKVVVFSFENRTWTGTKSVGGTQFQSMPYFNSLARQCSTFADYTEPDPAQSSGTQYVGQAAGSIANTVRGNCQPSTTCRSTQDNIFRQVRRAGLVARSYVEGATSSCSASGNAAKHVGALYFFGTYTDATGTHNDNDFCAAEVRPYSEFNPNAVADFSFITPTLCNDGHDCPNSTVDAWASTNVQAVLDSAAYRAGDVLVFIWYDEDYPTPNMQIGLHVTAGVRTVPVDYGSTLRAWEDVLGLPHIGRAVTATPLSL